MLWAYAAMGISFLLLTWQFIGLRRPFPVTPWRIVSGVIGVPVSMAVYALFLGARLIQPTAYWLLLLGLAVGLVYGLLTRVFWQDNRLLGRRSGSYLLVWALVFLLTQWMAARLGTAGAAIGLTLMTFSVGVALSQYGLMTLKALWAGRRRPPRSLAAALLALILLVLLPWGGALAQERVPGAICSTPGDVYNLEARNALARGAYSRAIELGLQSVALYGGRPHGGSGEAYLIAAVAAGKQGDTGGADSLMESARIALLGSGQVKSQVAAGAKEDAAVDYYVNAFRATLNRWRAGPDLVAARADDPILQLPGLPAIYRSAISAGCYDQYRDHIPPSLRGIYDRMRAGATGTAAVRDPVTRAVATLIDVLAGNEPIPAQRAAAAASAAVLISTLISLGDLFPRLGARGREPTAEEAEAYAQNMNAVQQIWGGLKDQLTQRGLDPVLRTALERAEAMNTALRDLRRAGGEAAREMAEAMDNLLEVQRTAIIHGDGFIMIRDPEALQEARERFQQARQKVLGKLAEEADAAAEAGRAGTRVGALQHLGDVVKWVDRGLLVWGLLSDYFTYTSPTVTDDGRVISADDELTAAGKALGKLGVTTHVGNVHPELAVLELGTFILFGGTDANGQPRELGDIMSPGKTMGGTLDALVDLIRYGPQQMEERRQAGLYGPVLRDTGDMAASLAEHPEIWSEEVTSDDLYLQMEDRLVDLTRYEVPKDAGLAARLVWYYPRRIAAGTVEYGGKVAIYAAHGAKQVGEGYGLMAAIVEGKLQQAIQWFAGQGGD